VSKPTPQPPAAKWISAYLDGTISDDDFASLCAFLRESPEHMEALAAAAQLDEMVRDSLSHADQVDLLADDALSVQAKTSAIETVDEFDLTDAASTDSTHTGVLALLAELEPSDDEIELVDLTQTLRDRERAKQQRRAQAQRRSRLQTAPVDDHRTRVIIIPKIVAVLGVAAMVGLVVWLGWPKQSSQPPHQGGNPPIAEVDPAPVVATLVRSLDARWLDDAGSWDGENGLREGEHRLAEGLVEIELTKGARVVLEAPVSFTLNHTNAMTLTDGRLVATVPPAAVGFTVDTPSAQIIDYGTEFGVDVMADGVTQAHVFTGKITVAAPQGTQPPSRLVQGEAGAVGPQGQVELLEYQPLAFVREDEFSARYHAEESAYQRWLAYSYELRRDPSVVLYYTFDSNDLSGRTVHNAVPGRAAERYNGTSALSGSAPGRFTEKPSAMFSRDRDHVAATLDHEMDAVTLAGWYWIDTMDGALASLLHTNSSSAAGGIHWHVNTNHGEGWAIEFVQLRRRNIQTDYWYDLLSPGWQPRSLSGRWVHLALCYDSVAGDSRLYVDGREVANEVVSDAVPVRLNTFRLGNWHEPIEERGSDWPRPLRGRIDEFVVLDRALSGQAIAAMFEAGRPDY